MSLQLEFDDSASRPDLERTGQLLSVMAKTGAPGELIAAMLNLALDGKLSKAHERFLCAPIIQQRSDWMDTTPTWLYEAITYDRLQVVLDELKRGEQKGNTVGPIELTTVIYPATMDAPVRYELFQIYMWAASQANAFHQNKPVEEIYEKLSMQPIPDEDIVSPSGQFHYHYKQLCADIRRKVVNAQIERGRKVKRTQEQTSLAPKPTIQGRQLDLF